MNKEDKRIINRFINWMLGISILITGGNLGIRWYLKERDLYLYITDGVDALLGLIAIGIVILLIIKIVLIIKNLYVKIAVGVISILFIARYSLLIVIILFSHGTYHEFESPKGEHTIVAEEVSVLLYGDVKFYEKENSFLIRELDISCGTDDGYRPISNKDYSLVWLSEDEFVFEYGFGNGRIRKEEIIKLKKIVRNEK